MRVERAVTQANRFDGRVERARDLLGRAGDVQDVASPAQRADAKAVTTTK